MVKYKIGDIAEEISVRENNPASSCYDKFVGLEHYIPGDVEIHNYGSTEKLNSAMKVFQAGDILIARRNVYLKRASVVNFDGITSGDSIVLRVKDRELSRILPFVLNSDEFWDFADQYADGTMSKRLSPKTLMLYEFYAPEKSEQKEYADLLWAAYQTKRSYEKLLIQTDELVKSQFIEMFGTYENTIYDVKKLEEICEPIKDGTHQTPTYTDDRVNGYLFLSSKDVTSRYVDWNHPMFIPPELHEELHKRIAPRKGDILLAKNGTTGIAAIVDRDIVFDIYVSLALLRPLKGINVKYLWQAINMPETKAQFDSRLKGVGVPNLHLGEIKQARIVVPPIELQDRFANFLEQSDKSKFEIQKSINRIDAVIKALVEENSSNMA